MINEILSKMTVEEKVGQMCVPILQSDVITEEIKRECKVAGMIHTERIPKYKLIGSHTGRRTFITINLLRGIPLHEIMRASGHTSYSAFQKYWCYYD